MRFCDHDCYEVAAAEVESQCVSQSLQQVVLGVWQVGQDSLQVSRIKASQSK